MSRNRFPATKNNLGQYRDGVEMCRRQSFEHWFLLESWNSQQHSYGKVGILEVNHQKSLEHLKRLNLSDLSAWTKTLISNQPAQSIVADA